jgi:hypothetical protein
MPSSPFFHASLGRDVPLCVAIRKIRHITAWKSVYITLHDAGARRPC